MKKFKWKNFICGALAVLTIVGVLAGATAFINNDRTAISSLKFSRGGLDTTTGKYIETKQSLYTEKAIPAEGLRIEPDFECTVTYDVFLYNDMDVLLEKSLGLTGVFENEFPVASRARIVIHPSAPEDLEDDEEWKISILEVTKYAEMLKVTVPKKESKVKYINLFSEKTALEGYTMVAMAPDTFDNIDDYTPVGEGENQNRSVSEKMDIKGARKVHVYFKETYPPEDYLYYYVADGEGQILIQDCFITSANYVYEGWHVKTIDLSDCENAELFRICYDKENMKFIHIYVE